MKIKKILLTVTKAELNKKVLIMSLFSWVYNFSTKIYIFFFNLISSWLSHFHFRLTFFLREIYLHLIATAVVVITKLLLQLLLLFLPLHIYTYIYMCVHVNIWVADTNVNGTVLCECCKLITITIAFCQRGIKLSAAHLNHVYDG